MAALGRRVAYQKPVKGHVASRLAVADFTLPYAMSELCQPQRDLNDGSRAMPDDDISRYSTLTRAVRSDQQVDALMLRGRAAGSAHCETWGNCEVSSLLSSAVNPVPTRPQ